MKFDQAIDLFIEDRRVQGRITSQNTVKAYRSDLGVLRGIVSNRDPRKVGRLDVKRALIGWDNPNTLARALACYRSFFDWMMEEGHRDTNPARMVASPKKRQPLVYRMTREEVNRLLAEAAKGSRSERWAIHLMLLAGLRRDELRGLCGRHLERDGWIWVSQDIAKGGKERWIPVLPELVPVIDEIRAVTGPSTPVILTRQSITPPFHTEFREGPGPMTGEGIYKVVKRVSGRCGLSRVTPHTLRHAFGDHIAKYAGLRAAQQLMGHSSVETTASTYVDRPTLDEVAVSVNGFRYGELSPQQEPSPSERKPNAR